MEQPTANPCGNCRILVRLIPFVGVLLGILAGILFFMGLIPNATALMIAFAVFALLSIGVIIALIAKFACACCVRKLAPWAVAAALGLLTLVIFTLGIVFLPGSVPLAILFGVIATLYFITALYIFFMFISIFR